ncbi:serine/threonine-protein kinase [Nannocystis sp. SCPEA4]|uniref:serine/threonine-protein kinase n=1 Tax=Nannocystis sp. SCPEA4 TaxID=2996787 RepID=UPI002271232B|nr:serine/threonine-protein kinase [Nannocystis sp. SCPEA4]MCY1057476.1 serine/threonine-protein kinase [Nannocystis sp. SCPEA4]
MSHVHTQELAMKLVDVDETPPDPIADDLPDDTQATPRLRPEVLADAAQRRTKAMVRAALFDGSGEAPTIGPYQVLRRLGEGGMGVVYAAYDDKLERKVALKLIRGAALRRPEGRARTLREARALARLSHPNVVHVYQVGEVDDEVFVAMEFLTGPTLRAWLAAQSRSWREVLAVFRQAGEGLAAAHRQGVVHRDFKPANVIVGDDGRVRVVDFGLAHFGGEGEATPALPPAGEVTDVLLTQTGAVLGTPAYMAAEQFAGARGDAKTDQFSFCAALYEALYGQRPFTGEDVQALASAVTAGQVRAPKTGPEVPAWLHRAVARGLQPDPAARWPAMDALLQALQPATGPRARRMAVALGSALALVAGGLGYVAFRTPLPATSAALHEDVAAAQAEVTRTQDAERLSEARAALTRDPVATIRALAQLAGDDPSTWHEARFLAAAAAARGLPAQVLHAERPLAEVVPLAGGGLVGRDELGAVWRWDMSEGTGEKVLAPGPVKALLAASEAPVWAVVGEASVQVFGDAVAQTIDLPDASERHHDAWQLAADGHTLVGFVWPAAGDPHRGLSLRLWDLARIGAPPRSIALPRGVWPALADDASTVAFADDGGTRVIRLRDGSEARSKYAGEPFALAREGRFAIARPHDDKRAVDVIEVATGESRRVDADWAMPVGQADALFMRPEYGHHALWRESLATGEIAWRMWVPASSPRFEERVRVEPAGDRFALMIGEDWAFGDLRRGGLQAFLTVPKDRSPQWAGDGAVVLLHRQEVRIHRPATGPVTTRRIGADCALAPEGRWAATAPWDRASGEFTRIEPATGATATFRCAGPSAALPGEHARDMLSTFVDDAGQVAVIGEQGWNCWWDAQHGARVGSAPLTGWVVGLPRGVARVVDAEVELWTAPDQRAQRWTAAGKVLDLRASPSGASLAVRSEAGVELLGVESGAVTPVVMEAVGRAETLAAAMTWSPDGAQLAVLRPVAGSLELTRWDMTGAPRELAKHVLKDSPGRAPNRLAFSPTGRSLALTDRSESLMLVGPDGTTRRIEAPDFSAFTMRSETEVLGIDYRGGPFMVDIAAGEVSPLTPNPDLVSSSEPPIRRAVDGTLWACDATGPGVLLGSATFVGETPQQVRSRIAALAAAL